MAASTSLSSGPLAAVASTSLMRILIGVPVAAVVTFGLFMFMRGMILAGDVELDERTAPPQLDIVSSKRDSDAVTRGAEPEQPDEVVTPPPPPEIEVQKAEAPQESLGAALGRLPEINPDDVGGDDFELVIADRDEQPLVRINPDYPPNMASRGVEGKCLMTFDIEPDGSTSNVRAECTSESGRSAPGFRRSAERAVARWKYAPRVRDGQAVKRFNQRTELVFQLQD